MFVTVPGGKKVHKCYMNLQMDQETDLDGESHLDNLMFEIHTASHHSRPARPNCDVDLKRIKHTMMSRCC